MREQAYRQRTTDPKAVTEATRELKRMELEEQYQAWVDEQVERAIAAKYPPAQVSARLQQLKKEILATHPGLYAQRGSIRRRAGTGRARAAVVPAGGAERPGPVVVRRLPGNGPSSPVSERSW